MKKEKLLVENFQGHLGILESPWNFEGKEPKSMIMEKRCSIV